MKIKYIVVLAAFICFSLDTSAADGCWYKGKKYSIGSVVNGYRCMPNGGWVKI